MCELERRSWLAVTPATGTMSAARSSAFGSPTPKRRRCAGTLSAQGAATRVTFDSADSMRWGIRLDDGVIRAEVEDNEIAEIEQAAISVVGGVVAGQLAVGQPLRSERHRDRPGRRWIRRGTTRRRP